MLFIFSIYLLAIDNKNRNKIENFNILRDPCIKNIIPFKDIIMSEIKEILEDIIQNPKNFGIGRITSNGKYFISLTIDMYMVNRQKIKPDYEESDLLTSVIVTIIRNMDPKNVLEVNAMADVMENLVNTCDSLILSAIEEKAMEIKINNKQFSDQMLDLLLYFIAKQELFFIINKNNIINYEHRKRTINEFSKRIAKNLGSVEPLFESLANFIDSDSNDAEEEIEKHIDEIKKYEITLERHAGKSPI